MKSVSVSEARNGFGELLRRARQGEATLITDRGKPVATLEPWRSDGAAMLLVQRGIAAPRARLDLEAFLAAPRPRLRAGVRASDAVTRERDESR